MGTPPLTRGRHSTVLRLEATVVVAGRIQGLIKGSEVATPWSKRERVDRTCIRWALAGSDGAGSAQCPSGANVKHGINRGHERIAIGAKVIVADAMGGSVGHSPLCFLRRNERNY